MFIKETVENHTLHWNISDQKSLNAIGLEISKELFELCNKVNKKIEKEHIKALVLSCNTVKTENSYIWIAGGNLKDLASFDKKEASLYSRRMTTSCLTLSTLPIPVIAFIDGQAIGGGAEIAIAADIRLATPNASLCFKQLDIGLCSGYGGAKRLVELVGQSRTTEILLLSKNLSATEAQNLGLFHMVEEQPSLEQSLNVMLEKFNTLPKPVIAAQKELILDADKVKEHYLHKQTHLFESVWKNAFHQKKLDIFNGGK